MSRDEAIWFAGFFEGEGSITVANGKSKSGGQPQLSLDQKFPAPLDLIAGITLLGKIHKFDSRPTHQWRCCGTGVQEILLEIVPFLVIKQAQARTALEWFRVPRENHERKRALMQKLRDQKKDPELT